MLTELRTCMNRHNLQRQQVAGTLGVNPGTVSRWLSGKQKISDNHANPVRDFVGRLDWCGTDYAAVQPEIPVQSDTESSVTLTMFTGPVSNKKPAVTKRYSWDGLSELLSTQRKGKKDGPYFVRGECNGNRCNANMVSAQVIVIDADKGAEGRPCPPVDLVIDALEVFGWEYILYTSYNHTPTEPRYRIILRPSRLLSGEEIAPVYLHVLHALAGTGVHVKISGESKTFSQPWFFPRYSTVEQKKNFLFATGGTETVDIDPIIATQKPIEDKQEQNTGLDIVETYQAIKSGEIFHPKLLALAAHYIGTGMAPVTAIKHLQAIMQLCENKDKRWHDRFAQIDKLVSTANAKFSFEEMEESDWLEPEPLKAELEPVPSFAKDLLPESIREWVMDVADRMCVPPDYVAVALVVIVSSIVGTSCRIRPKRNDDWTVVPNLWGAACGYPSDGKTPSFEDVLTNSVSRLEQEASEGFTNSMKEFSVEELVEKEIRKIKEKALKEALGKGNDIDSIKADLMETNDGNQPKKRRYRTNNASVEKIGEILRDNPRGILVYRDELVGAFTKWDENGDRPFYLESWSGKSSYIDDKIGRGTTEVPKVCLSILGTIQPDRITSYLTGAISGHDNDGFVQRFQLLIFPDRIKWQYVDRKPDAAARERTFSVIHSLAHADYTELTGDSDYALFSFDDEAQDLFIEWFTDLHNNKIGSTDDHPVLVEHFGKYRSLMPSLALIFHLLDASMWVVDTPVDGLPSYHYHRSVRNVPVSCVSTAIAWCEFLEAHARRIYGMATSAGVRAAAILAEKIKGGKLDKGFSRRTISRKGWKMLSDNRIIDDAIEILIDKNWIREEVPPVVIRKGGPMPLPCFEINGKVFLKCGKNHTDITDTTIN